MLHPLRLEVDALSASPVVIDLALVRRHINVSEIDFDSVIEVYLSAAIKWAENTTHRTLFARHHVWVLKEFPCTGRLDIRLPRGKTQSISSIVYSNGGNLVTLTGPSSAGSPPGDDYQEDLRGDDGGILMPRRGGSWPSVDCDVPAPVAISFTAGWTADEVPDDIVHALMFFVADAFDLRGTPDFSPAMIAAGGPRFDVREALISAYRLSRWY